MKKIVLIVISLLLAFYVGWPLWSAYRIHAALEANDAQALETKVDFASVRASLKPSVTAEVERALDKTAGGIAGRLLGGSLKQQLTPQLADTILAGVVTPNRIGELYRRRGDIKDFLAERIAKRAERETAADGGARADQSTVPVAPATTDGKPPRKVGFANIKRFAYTGPLEVELGVARDVQAPAPDVVARLGFTGFDWKLVALVPRAR